MSGGDGGRVRPDRLAPPDLALLWPEDHGWPQDIGLIAILEASALGAGDVGADEERLLRHLGERLPLLPERFAKLLVRPPFGLGLPYWVDAPVMDVRRHLGVVVLDPPGDEDQLLATCERLRRERFADGAPLWRLTLLTGLADGRSALFLNAHHCLVDGASGIAALAAFVHEVPVAEVRGRTPMRPPTSLELFIDAAARHLVTCRRVLRLLADVPEVRRRIAANRNMLRHLRDSGAVAMTSVNSALGSGRRMAVVRGELEEYRQIGRTFGATVNDALLAVVAGGFRDLLAARDELADAMVFRVVVPVSLHATSDGATGNNDGGMLLPLPVDEPDAAARLALIARASAERKRSGVMPGATSGLFRVPLLQRLMIRLAARQRMSNGYVANVRGPSIALSFAGARIERVFPVVPLLGNTTIGVGALSYDGQFNITAVVDEDACPDLDIFMAGMRSARAALLASARDETRLVVGS